MDTRGVDVLAVVRTGRFRFRGGKEEGSDRIGQRGGNNQGGGNSPGNDDRPGMRAGDDDWTVVVDSL